jgi:hypothetical protein
VNSNSLLKFCCLTLLAAGCGRSTEQAQVVGNITWDGVPVENARIYLSTKAPPSKKSKAPATFTAAVVDGSFQFQRPLPPPGEYVVTVQPVDLDVEELLETLKDKQGNPIKDRDRLLAAVAKKGPIHVELTAGDVNELEIELTSR